jgi:hypothetical protein
MLSLKLIDIDLVKFSCRDLVFEQGVEFSICAALALRQHEEHEDSEDGGEACVEEPRHAGPVPVCWREHAWHDDVVEDAALLCGLVAETQTLRLRREASPYHVVQVTCQDDGLDLEPSRGYFGYDGVANRPEYTSQQIVCTEQAECFDARMQLRGIVSSWLVSCLTRQCNCMHKYTQEGLLQEPTVRPRSSGR